MHHCGERRGRGSPGGKGPAGSVREARVEGVGKEIPKVVESGRDGGQFRKRGRDQQKYSGNRHSRVRKAGGLNPPVPLIIATKTIKITTIPFAIYQAK